MSAGPSGESVWTVTDSEASIEARVLQMMDDGMSIRDVAEELKIGKSTIHRIRMGGGVPLSQLPKGCTRKSGTVAKKRLEQTHS